MKLYTTDTPHDNSITCACNNCIKEKGNILVVKIQKESLPWESKKEPQFNNINYELKEFSEGYCYIDKNIKIWQVMLNAT